MVQATNINPLRPGISVDDFANNADPHAVFSNLRENYPVCQLEPNGYWAISQYNDIQFACKRPKLFSSIAVQEELLQPDWMPEDCKRTLFVLALNPPEHKPLRRKLDTEVGHRRILEALVPVMRQKAEQLVKKIDMAIKTDPTKEIDFIASFASPYIETFINKLVGSEKKRPPPEELADHPERTNKNISGTPAEPYQQEQIDLIRRSKSYFHTLIGERRKKPKNDLISALLEARFDGKPLSDYQIWNAAELVNLAGTQGPVILQGHAMIRLARQPELLKLIVKSPQLIPRFIEELLRHASPAPAVLRKTTEGVTVSGVNIPKGAKVMLLYGAANRDPRMFPNPDMFDMTRENLTEHLAFGHGPHFCAGAAMTRLEVGIALEAILAKFHNFSCPPDNEIIWNNSWMANSMETLPIQLR